jgi:FtsZ-binding cell division protein ZapB
MQNPSIIDSEDDPKEIAAKVAEYARKRRLHARRDDIEEDFPPDEEKRVLYRAVFKEFEIYGLLNRAQRKKYIDALNRMSIEEVKKFIEIDPSITAPRRIVRVPRRRRQIRDDEEILDEEEGEISALQLRQDLSQNPTEIVKAQATEIEKLKKENQDLEKKNQDLERKNQDLTKRSRDLEKETRGLTKEVKSLKRKLKNRDISPRKLRSNKEY